MISLPLQRLAVLALPFINVTLAQTCGNGVDGIANSVGSACCPLACGACGGSGCGTFNAVLGRNCCTGGVLSSGISCSASGTAPCVIDTPAPTPAPVANPTPAPICPAGTSGCDDPHVAGLSGQRIAWSGEDGGWYCFVKDNELDLQVNVRVTAPLAQFPDRQLMTGVAVLSEGHTLVVEVVDPYTITTNGCPAGVSPCLNDGGVRFMVDGLEAPELLSPTRRVQLHEDGIVLSAGNLPVECRQFGAHKIWAEMFEEMQQGRRMLRVESFEEWVLRFPHMAAPGWCAKYVAEKGLDAVQSSHAVYKIETPDITVRVNTGTNFQGDGEVDWDGTVLPDLDFWQMDVGLEGSPFSEDVSGILGETARPMVDEKGHAVMEGPEAMRGSSEDYRVSGALGTDFAMLHYQM